MSNDRDSKDLSGHRNRSALAADEVIRRIRSESTEEVAEMRDLLTDLIEDQTWEKALTPEPTAAEGKGPQGPTLPNHLFPDWEVTVDGMLLSIEPEVRAIRSELFGDSKAPFQTREQAATWIADQSASRNDLSTAEQEEWQQLYKRLEGLVSDLERVAGIPMRLRLTEVTLDYIPPGIEVATGVSARLDSPLSELASFAERSSRKTLFQAPSIVNYVLLGERPQLERVEAPVKAPSPPSRTQITINAQNICRDDLIFAWKRISHGRPKSNLIDLVDQDVWNAVRALGGLPDPEGNEEFWRKVQKRVEETGHIKYESWRGPMMRWRRLEKNHPWLWTVLQWGI